MSILTTGEKSSYDAHVADDLIHQPRNGIILEGVDLNTITTGGRYGVVGSNNTNAPVSGDFAMDVLAYPSGRVMQIATFGDGKISVRVFIDSWSSWINPNAPYDAHIANESNPHRVTQEQLGLSNFMQIRATGATNPTTTHDVLLLKMDYGDNARDTANAGGKMGIHFCGDPQTINAKSAGIYLVSEDFLGYNRTVSLAFYVTPFMDGQYEEAMRIKNGKKVLIGKTTDDGVGLLQVAGKITAHPNVVSYTTMIGRVNSDWRDTNILINNDYLGTYVLTVYEDSYKTGNGNYAVVYKYLIGMPQASSDDADGKLIEIPCLSKVARENNGGTFALAWKLSAGNVNASLIYRIGIESEFDDTPGKQLQFTLTKLI